MSTECTPTCPGDYVSASTPEDAQHRAWMKLALVEARRALATCDVPIGALVVDAQGQVIGAGHNQREAKGDPTAHAEVVAIRAAAEHLGSWRLDGCTLIVTLEPCVMCAGAILLARIPRIVLGAWEEKMGATGSVYDLARDRRLPLSAEVYSGVCEDECAKLLTDFFADKRL